jgi:hypothetical protein
MAIVRIGEDTAKVILSAPIDVIKDELEERCFKKSDDNIKAVLEEWANDLLEYNFGDYEITELVYHLEREGELEYQDVEYDDVKYIKEYLVKRIWNESGSEDKREFLYTESENIAKNLLDEFNERRSEYDDIDEFEDCYKVNLMSLLQSHLENMKGGE